jgi:hypothetical protein
MLRLAVSLVVVATYGVLPHGSQGAEIVPMPVVRDVLLNLAIDDLKTQTPVQLKRMSVGVLAQGIKPLPEALQFEVVVKGAHPDIPVLFPVPQGSPVCCAYEQFINTDPSRVLASLGLVKMPTVRVVAVRATYVYEAYNEGELAECKPTCEWVPFYEVSMAASACPKPVMIPVPQRDKTLHALAKRVVNKSLGPHEVVPVIELSGDNSQQFCPHCEPAAPCGRPDCGHPGCGHGGCGIRCSSHVETCCSQTGPIIPMDSIRQ